MCAFWGSSDTDRFPLKLQRRDSISNYEKEDEGRAGVQE